MPNDRIDSAAKMSTGNAHESGIRANKANVDEYEKATDENPAPPKAASPQPAQAVDKLHVRSKFGSNSGEKRYNVSDMVKPLGSFAKGTDYVPATGPYTLHKGEAVVTAKENRMDFSDIMDTVKDKFSSAGSAVKGASAKGSGARAEAGKLGDAFDKGHDIGR